MIYGYFRYSNNFSELLGILQNFGCDRIISDSAEHRTRPHFLSLLLTLQVGDTLVVVSFNHMGYRLTPFFELLLDFQNKIWTGRCTADWEVEWPSKNRRSSNRSSYSNVLFPCTYTRDLPQYKDFSHYALQVSSQRSAFSQKIDHHKIITF